MRSRRDTWTAAMKGKRHNPRGTVRVLCAAITAAMVCLMLSPILVSVSAQSQLDLGGRSDTTIILPTRGIKEQLAQIDEQLSASRDRWRNVTGPSAKPAREAVEKLHMIARDMLTYAASHPQSSSAALVLYGSTLAQHLHTLDSQIELVARLSDAAESDTRSAASIAQAQLAVRRLKRLTDVNLAAVTWPNMTTPQAVRQWCRQTFSPLLLVRHVVDQTPLMDAWPPGDGRHVSQPIDMAARLAAVAEQIDQLPLNEASIVSLKQTFDVLQRGAELPEYEADLRMLMGWYEQALKACEIARGASWLDRGARDKLLLEIGTAVAAYSDAAKRPQAVLRMRRASHWCDVVDRISQLKVLHVLTRDLEPAAARMILEEVHDPRSAWLDRMTALLLVRAQLMRDVARTPFRAVALQINKDALSYEPAVLATAQLVMDDTNARYTPAVTSPTRIFEDTVDTMRLLVDVSRLLVATRPIDPPRATAMERRVRDAVGALLQDNRQQAERQLRAFVLQANMVLSMRQTIVGWQAKEGADDTRRVAMQRLVELHSTQWIRAWAEGRDVIDAGGALQALAPVVTASVALASLVDGPRAMEQFNRWQAIELSTSHTMQKLIDARRASDQVADQLLNSPAAEWRGDMLQRAEIDPATMLFITTYDRVSAAAPSLAEGASGCLAQLMFEPATDAYLGEHEHELAVLSWYFSEPGRSDGMTELQRRRLSLSLEQMADRVLAAQPPLDEPQD